MGTEDRKRRGEKVGRSSGITQMRKIRNVQRGGEESRIVRG